MIVNELISDALLADVRGFGILCAELAVTQGATRQDLDHYRIVGGDWDGLVTLCRKHGIESLYGYGPEDRPIMQAFQDGVTAYVAEFGPEFDRSKT